MPRTATRRGTPQLAKDTFAALKPYINSKDPGMKLPDGEGGYEPRHTITKEMRHLYSRHCDGERDLFYQETGKRFQHWHIFSNYTSAKVVWDMLCGSTTHYYTGGKEGKTLVYLDIDAHDGQPDQDASADAIAHFLGPHHLLRVLSARGVNLYLKLVYGLYTKRADVNRALMEFDAAWKRFQKANDLLCTVEIKGSITTKEKSGSLAKLPCNREWNYPRLKEFQELPEVTLGWLKGATAALNEQSEKLERAKPKPTATVVPTGKPRIRSGSTTGLPLNEDELQQIPQAISDYRKIGFHCMAFRTEPKAKGKKLTHEDFTQALVLLSICAKYPNKDGSTPHNRVQSIWNALHAEGIFQRGFDNSRWAAIRNTLADLGYLELQDETYFWFQDGDKKGQAMKWCLKAEFCCTFEDIQPLLILEDGSTNIFARGYSPNAHDYVPERWRPEPKDPRRSLFDAPDWEERLIMALAG
jgi:hypothetical protein